MTKEEAMRKMQAVKLHMTSGNPIWGVTEMAEAFDMAIEALSNNNNQTDSEIRTSTDSVSEADVIYRRDAIDAIDEIDWYHQNRNKDMVSGANSDEHQAWYKADDVYKALEQITSAQRTGEWIAKDIHNCWTRFECSDCGYYHEPTHDFGESVPQYNFCPNCGARMEDEDNE